MSIQTIDATIDASAAHYGADEESVRTYLRDGLQRAYDLENRGPIRFEDDGKLHPDIVDAYSRYGFYVFENVLAEEELADIEADIEDIRQRLPTEPDSPVDKQGRPALGADLEARTLIWAKPLSDPLGGTEFANGRHQVKLFEPEPAADAPTDIVYLIVGSLQFSEAALRVYGHPQLLEIAAQINGEDFVPFNEALFIKEPGLGAAVSWHQDGTTHWDNPDLDEGTHGFNFMAQLYGSDPVNGVWFVPGTHKMGKLDIKKMVEEAGTERLPGAIPLVCGPGDVVIANRQLVHGSFANRRMRSLPKVPCDCPKSRGLFSLARQADRESVDQQTRRRRRSSVYRRRTTRISPSGRVLLRIRAGTHFRTFAFSRVSGHKRLRLADYCRRCQ